MMGKRSRWRQRVGVRSGTRRPRRGVSDVVATILLLALTITLFAAIFAFVTSFPAPPAQSNNQFQASLFSPSNGSTKYIAGVHIVHLAGPVVSGTALVYLKSAIQPALSIFQTSYTVSSGIGGAATWNLGQTWSLSFPATELPLAGGNMTVYIVSQSQLLFSVILPGTSITPPPTIVSTSTSPATPAIGQTFTVYASLSGAYKTNSVYVNLAGVPGAPTTPEVMKQNAQGQWYYNVTGGASKNGTYFGYVNATSSINSGQTAVGAVTIIISATGGTTNGPFSVGVVLIPSPANGNTTESVQAVVSYTGVLASPTALNVTFTAITSPYTAANKWVSWAPSGVTITGGTSVTVVAKSTWLIPSPFTHPSVTAGTAFKVYANATVTGIGTVPGTLTFTPAYVNTGATKATLIGNTISANGTYFAPLTVVVLSIGGVGQTLTSCSVGTLSASDLNVTTNATGAFTCKFAIAAGTPMSATNLLATDLTTGQNATASFTPTGWTVSVSPTSGRIGILVNVTGTGFVASSSVALSMGGASVTVSSCSSGTAGSSAVTATSSGGFVCKIGVPYGISSGSVSIVATYSAGLQTATTSYSVTAWKLTVAPTSVAHGTAGTKLYLNGSGFAPLSITGTTGSNVTITLNGTLLTSGSLSYACTTGTLTGSTITTTYGGSFACTITIGKSAAAGVWTFVATDFTSGQSATAVFQRT